MCASRVEHSASFDRSGRERFFTQHPFALFQSPDRPFGVQGRRQSDIDGIDIGCRDSLLEVRCNVVGTELPLPCLEFGFVPASDSADLMSRIASNRVDHPAGHTADSKNSPSRLFRIGLHAGSLIA